jgi:predicted Zn-dependent peptidase
MNRLDDRRQLRRTDAAAQFLLAAILVIFSRHIVADVRIPPFERVQLSNGTVLLLMERHEVPLISFRAVSRGGALTDAAGQSGMSSLLAAMLEKGAGARNAFAFANAIASVGGSISTDADAENLSVRGSFLARDQALMIELLSDMLQRPRLQAGEFEALRARHIEFIRAAKDSDLESLAEVYGRAAFFKDHPYGRPVMGSEAELAAIAHADLQRHYQAQLGADRLIVAVAGDFKTSQMKQALNRAFTGWRKAAAPLPSATGPAPPQGRRVLLVDAPDSVQSYFWMGGPGVPRNFPDRAPLDVVNTVFGGRFTSMLNSELRIRSGLSYGATSGFDRFTQSGDWHMDSFTRTQTTAEAIDRALAVLDQLHQQAPDPELLASGRSYVQGQFPLGFETAGQWANALADLEFYGLDRNYIDGYGAAIAAVSLQDAQRVIRERFPTAGSLTLVVIGNATAIRDSLRKYGPLTEMKLSDPAFVAK